MEEQVEKIGTQLIGKYGWMFVVTLVAFFFRNTVEKIIDGLQVFIGGDYNADDVVEVDGKPGRIVRIGFRKTTFFLYHILNGKIVSGEKLVIQNEKLKDLKIAKPLPELDLARYKQEEERQYGRRADDNERRKNGNGNGNGHSSRK